MSLRFKDLTDVPSSYVGQAGKGVRVKSDESGLEFFTIPWPTIQVHFFRLDVLDSDQVVLRYVSVEPWTLPADLDGARGNVAIYPTATATLWVRKNGSNIGTITITTGGSMSFATTGSAAVPFAIGDILEVLGPSVADATLAQIAITFTGPKT